MANYIVMLASINKYQIKKKSITSIMKREVLVELLIYIMYDLQLDRLI